MQFLEIKRIKVILIVSAILIAVTSLYISHKLIKDLSLEEELRMEVWAAAMSALNTADDATDLNLVLKVINANNTIPVIVTDSHNSIQIYRNIDITSVDTVDILNHKLELFKESGKIITIDLGNTDFDFINVYYEDSLMLTRLSVYPYVQLGVVLIFVLVAIFALLSSKKAEQNKVWVGLSKETAHQLGTPISSLIAWGELLRVNYPNDNLIPSMIEDVDRLQMIANRFSKIGSIPELTSTNLYLLLKSVTDYISNRTSSKVSIVLVNPDIDVFVKLNSSLFSWVIENLCKNAIDAMNGIGLITISISSSTTHWLIDIEDTGKGIIRSNHKMIFTPGYTTKKRGWGLGLSLARRIVEEYHSGRIYVKQSEINKGTIFRIELKK